MERRLSADHIESFCGNVVPLRLLGGQAFGKEAVTWRCEGEAVQLTAFADFTDGVLLTLLTPGSALVTAILEGREYRCAVSVREMKHAASGTQLQYFIGDFHDHTCKKHKVEEFQAKESDYPADIIRKIRDEGKLDFCVISDHACLLNDREYYRGYADMEDAGPMELVVFPGCEAEITPLETDRYGIVHKNAGEIVTVNACNYSAVDTWEDFFRDFSCSPFAVSCFAHPQTVGSSTKGMWNFCLEKNNGPRLRQMVRLVEMGNGTPLRANLINEYVYSTALDNGFRLSPACNSDCHGPHWGYDAFPGKTVIMAPERSREAFLDAISHNRVYATESGNVKLYWSVCGMAAPADLPLTARYDFHVELSSFHEDPTTVPVKCQVISDYGICLRTVENFDASGFDFTVESDTARYFYLRLVDGQGRRTWSCPVWTGRTPDEKTEDMLVPLEKSGFTAVEELTGSNASGVVNDDPEKPWFSDGTACSILIDMGKTQQIAGLGHYPRLLELGQMQREDMDQSHAIAFEQARFPYAYRISTSLDGKDFAPRASGVFRIFGGETVVPFEAHAARFVRVEILSAVGRNSEQAAYRDSDIAIGELTVYKHRED